ncbi:hypothetical protein N8T08_000973 [Aspergillus melleus]|uniref:Uncharacterized protein n=1 Tax=Aspergillus melleus TaxID=138277 RepID=A0ACC3BAV0_9EURO|nr:hypothetical protein N8T08_000973 [Aspergillus melleus]
MEIYGDQSLTEDTKEHGPKVVELLQNMDFPKLDSDPLIDEIIKKCWHNEYNTIADLASNTEMLLSGHPDAKGSGAKTSLISRAMAVVCIKATYRGISCGNELSVRACSIGDFSSSCLRENPNTWDSLSIPLKWYRHAVSEGDT